MSVSPAFAAAFSLASKKALRDGVSLMEALDRAGLLRTHAKICEDRSDGALELLVRLRGLDAARLLQSEFQRAHGSPAETLIAVKNEAQGLFDDLTLIWRET